MKIVVLGAGVAGLLAARRLSHDHQVVVIDKGRGVGGRLATRRIGQATFDHGTQFFTAKSPEFAAVVDEWCALGAATPWHRHLLPEGGAAVDDGHVRYRGVGGMTAIAKHLAQGLDVRLMTTASAVTTAGPGWRVTLDQGGAIPADALVLTAPVPQTLALLDAGAVAIDAEQRAPLDAITYDRCLAVMAPLAGPSAVAEPGAARPACGHPVEWIADNQRKGVSTTPGVTLHASPNFSAEHWETPAAEVASLLLAAVGLADQAVLDTVQVHRWRYAKPTVGHPERCVRLAAHAPLILAGDAFGGPLVEGAALSGLAAARALAG